MALLSQLLSDGLRTGKRRTVLVTLPLLALATVLLRLAVFSASEGPTIEVLPLPSPRRVESTPTHGLNGESIEVEVDTEAEVGIAPPRLEPSTSTTATEVIDLHRNDWPVPAVLDDTARYLSYLPHNGFDNQRIALVNALVLATLLNRTLLVPSLTMGEAIPWQPTEALHFNLEQAERGETPECIAVEDSDGQSSHCGELLNRVRASWSWLLDADRISSEHRVMTREHMSRNWLKETLQLEESDIHRFPDSEHFSNRKSHPSLPPPTQLLTSNPTEVYELANTPPPLGYTPTFANRLYLADLLDLEDVKLLEFGSLFNPARLVLSHKDSMSLFERTERMMVFNESILDAVSDAIAERLGGRDTYFAVHLHIGKSFGNTRTVNIFNKVCHALGLDVPTTTALRRTIRHHGSNLQIHLAPANPSTSFSPSAGFSCPSALHPPSSPLAPLNRVLFIATDKPAAEELAMFRNTFPCVFFFDDMQDREEVKRLGRLVGDGTGQPLERYLVPFVEALVIGKAQVALGTPTSTFSNFAVGTLFDAYHTTEPEIEFETASQVVEWAGRGD